MAYSRGMGALGLPGDLSSGSRLCPRRLQTQLHSAPAALERGRLRRAVFPHHGDGLADARLLRRSHHGEFECTIYTSCWNAGGGGIYYYTTYGNRRITAVNLHRAPSGDSTALRRYPMLTAEDILMQNGGAGA